MFIEYIFLACFILVWIQLKKQTSNSKTSCCVLNQFVSLKLSDSHLFLAVASVHRVASGGPRQAAANLILQASASERSSARFPDQPPRAWTLPSTSLHLCFSLLCWMCLISFSHIFFHHYPSQRHSGGTEACSPARCPWWSVQCGPELRAHYLGRVANQVKRQEPGKLVEVGVLFFLSFSFFHKVNATDT